jgi:hypothetical protein
LDLIGDYAHLLVIKAEGEIALGDGIVLLRWYVKGDDL